MTKKDYERAAKIAKAYATPEVYQGVVNAFVALFSGDNPRFDEARFRKACALTESEKEALKVECGICGQRTVPPCYHGATPSR